MHINFHSTMGRPKTTGCSRNKSSRTYRSERKILTTSGGQKKLPDLFKSKVQGKATISDNEQQSTSSSFSSLSSSVGIVPVNISYDVNENESSDNPSDNENMDTKAPIGGRSYLVVHQSREKWENLYLFSSFLLLKMDGCASYAQNMGKVMNLGGQKVLSKRNILTAHSLHMKNPKSTQRQSQNVQK